MMVLKMLGLLVTLNLLVSSRYSSVDASPNYVNFDCGESDYTYSKGSPFQADLNHTLFSVLATNASVLGFSNFSTGQGIDQLYALYLCRGDIKAQDCHDCVQAAANKILQVCPLLKEGIVWYEECMLRYANHSIFSLKEDNPIKRAYNRTSLWSEYHLDPFQDTIDTAMDELVNQAAYNQSLHGFAASPVDLSSSETLRGLVQCTPDILGTPCDTCLRTALRQKDTWANTMIFLPSCLVRFDLYGSQTPPPIPPAKRDTHKVIIAVAVPIGLALLLGGSFLLWSRRCCAHEKPPIQTRNQDRYEDHNGQGNSSTREEPNQPAPVDGGRPGFKRFSYFEVENMTSGFKRKIGEGGFGVVYYGRLTDGTTEVAVKMLSKDAPRQFSTEIEVFGKISHKNLVSLVGYCQEGTSLALIYEYMAGGDLKALLSGSDLLSWKKRLAIAIDSAQGLDYLHHGCRPPIVHRDVKTPNILLNQNLQAKMADFGMSKIFPDEYVSVLSTRVIGSPGYLDPQYHLTGQLNEKSDVYSFGVVLLELITGKAALVIEKSNLVQWVKPLLERGDMDSIVDPRLQQIQHRASVWRATDIAMECVKLNAMERPTMSTILTELKECLAVEMDPWSPSAPHNPTDIMSPVISSGSMAPLPR